MDLELRYELPTLSDQGEESYVQIVQRGSVVLGQDYVFRIPYNVLLTGTRKVFLKTHAVAGIEIFRLHIHQNPECFHVWGNKITF